MSDRRPPHSDDIGPGDGPGPDDIDRLRDARLTRALAHAPDAELRPPARLRGAIREAAAQAVSPGPRHDAPAAPAARASATPPRTRWLDRWRAHWHDLGRLGRGGQAAFATLLIGVLAVLMWRQAPLPDHMPGTTADSARSAGADMTAAAPAAPAEPAAPAKPAAPLPPPLAANDRPDEPALARQQPTAREAARATERLAEREDRRREASAQASADSTAPASAPKAVASNAAAARADTAQPTAVPPAAQPASPPSPVAAAAPPVGAPAPSVAAAPPPLAAAAPSAPQPTGATAEAPSPSARSAGGSAPSVASALRTAPEAASNARAARITPPGSAASEPAVVGSATTGAAGQTAELTLGDRRRPLDPQQATTLASRLSALSDGRPASVAPLPTRPPLLRLTLRDAMGERLVVDLWGEQLRRRARDQAEVIVDTDADAVAQFIAETQDLVRER